MSPTSKDIQALEQTLASDPRNRDAFEALEEEYIRALRWQDLLKLYESHADVAQESVKYWESAVTKLETLSAKLEELPERADVMIAVGNIWEHKLERRDQAMMQYQRAFKVWPYKTEALDLARNIYASQKNWKLVSRLYDLELQVEKDPVKRAVIHVHKARIASEDLDEIEESVALLRKALELDPDSKDARAMLSALTNEAPVWEDKLAKLREDVERAGKGTSAAGLHVSIAQLLLDNDPTSEDIEKELKEALAIVPHHAEARDLICEVYRREGRWEELSRLLETIASDQMTRKEVARQALIELAALQRDQFDDEAASVATFERLLALDPSHPDALRFAQRFYEENEDWTALVGLYDNALKLKRSTPDELELRIALGEVLWQKVEDLPAAERHFRRVRLADPRRPEMLQFYRHFFQSQGNWKKYYSTLATLRQAVDGTDEQLEISFEMARVASEEMKSPEKAIDVWKSVIKLDPTNAEARSALHDLFIEARKWNALLEHYKEEIGLLEVRDTVESREARVGLHLKMVDIYRDKLRLDVMVINTYNAILQIDPVNADAIDALATRYEKSKRWNDLISILQRKADVIGEDNPAETLPLLHRIASLWQKRLGNISNAIPSLEKILEIDPTDRDAINELKKIYNKRHKWPELLVVLERESELLEGKAQAAHLSEMAVIARQRLSDPDQARTLYERVCDALDSGDEVADASLYRGALGALEQLYGEKGDDEALVRVLERRLQVTDSKGQKIDTLEQLAGLVYDSLGDSDRAVGLWREMLTMAPDHSGALERLKDHYVQQRQWEDLEALFGDRGDWPALFEILDTGASIVEDDASRVDLFHRMARIAREKLQDPDRVMLSLESVLEIEPTNIEVASSLLPFYRDAGEAQKEIQANLILLENDGGDAFVLSREIGRLYETSLEDLPGAFDWADKAFRMRPDDGDLRLHIESLARSADRLAEMVTSYRQVAEETEDGAVRLELYRTVARTANVDLEWFDDAVDYYERILSAEEADSEAIDALLILYRQLERWEDLLEVMQRKLALLGTEDDHKGVSKLNFQIAELLQGPLDRRGEAIESYRTILDAEPENLDAIRGLKALHEAEEDWSGVATAMESELGLLEKRDEAAEAGQLRLGLGHLYENRLEEPNQAVDWYASLLSREDASRAPAVSALEGMLGESGQTPDDRRVRIAGLLEPVHRKDDNHGPLAEMLEIRLGAMEEDGERASTLWELAGLYEQRAEDLGGAFSALRRLLALTPSDDKVWNELERLAGQIDRWEVIAELYGELVPSRDNLDGEPWRFELLRRQARIFEQELERDGDARESYEVLLARDSADRLTIDSLDKVYGRLGANAELVDLLTNKANLVEDAGDRRLVRFRIAEIHESALSDPDAAIDTYREVLVEHPSDEETLGRLERLLTERERWSDLVDLLSRRIDLAEEGTPRHDIKFQLGQVLQNQLSDPSGAVGVYREIVEQDPQHTALAALEDLSTELDAEDGDLTLRRTIDNTLEPIYKDGESWTKLAGILGLKLGYADNDAERVELRGRLARLYRDRLEEPEVAFDHLSEAVGLHFEDEALRGELEALADVNGAHIRVIGLYENGLDNLGGTDPTLQRQVLQRMATLQEDKLSDAGAAVDAYRRMLDIDGADTDALGSLERLHESEAQWDELVQVRLRQADQAEGDDRVTVLRKVGDLYRGQLADTDAAIDTYKRILDLKSGDAGALDALEGLYIEQSAWRELVGVLHEKILATEDNDEKRGHYFRIASLQEDNLQEPYEAIEVYNQVLTMLPDDRAALDALDRLYGEHERWPELAGILDRKLAQEDDADAGAELQFRLGQVQQHRLFTVEEAIGTYSDILARQPAHESPRRALVALLDDSEHRFAASKVLEPLYRKEALHADLVGLLELQFSDTEEDEGRLALLDDVARIQESELEDKTAAFHAARRAYLIDPSASERTASMERLAAETGEWGSLVKEAYEQALPDKIFDAAEILRVHLKVATIYRDELEDPTSAESSFRAALNHEPTSLAAMEALEDLLTDQQRWHDLLDILREKFGALAGQEDKAPALAVLFKTASIYDSILSEPTEAIETYRRVLDLDEANAEAIHALKALYRREGRWEDLTALLIQEIGYAEDSGRAVGLRSELAEVYHVEIGDVRQAVEVYSRILEDAPDHGTTIAALEALFEQQTEEQLVAQILEPIYRRREAWGPLVKVLEVRLNDQYDGPDSEGVLIQIARINEERLGDAEAAMGAYERLLDENPTVSGVWDQLERLASGLESWDRVADAYGRTLDENLKVDDAVRLPLLLRRAHVLDERLDRIEEAMVVYRDVLIWDESNAVAIDALDRIYTRLESWVDLVELYRRSAMMASEPAEQLALLYKIATLFEEILRTPDDAIDAYRRVLDVEPDERDAVRGLERLYQQEEMWRELAELYRNEAMGADDDNAAIGLKHQLATVLCGELGEVAEAIGIFRDILEARSDYAPTRRALEELLRNVGDADLRYQIADLLQPLYNEETEWEKLVHAYEVKLEVDTDPTSRVGFLREVARLKEAHQNNPATAFEAYARAFSEDVRDTELQGHLERLAAEIGNWGALIEIYLSALGSTDDQARTVEMLHRAAELYIDKLDDASSAITVYSQILDVEETDTRAIARLETLYENAGQWKDLVDVLYRKAEMEEAVLEKKETYYRIAELWEKSLGDDQMAIDTYRLIMDIDEEDLSAIEALERLYRRTEAWENLIVVYQVKVDVVTGPTEKVAVYKQMAEVYEHGMLESDEAIDTYQTIRDIDAGNLDAIKSLNRLYASEQRWNDLLDVLVVERDLTEDPVALGALEFRMGQLLEEEIDQPERAIEMYRQIVERTPDHQPALEALEALVNNPRCRQDAARVLEPLYEKQGEWRKLVDALELTLQETDEPDARRRLLERIASIHQDKLESRQMAFITYGRAFREAPEHDSPRAFLESLAGEMGNYDELVAIYEEKLPDIYDYDLVTSLLLRLGELYNVDLGDPREAVERYQRVLEIDEVQPEALNALDGLYARLEEWQDLVQILERKVRISEGREQLELKYRLAYRLDVLFDDYDQSIALYRDILTEDPEHKGALEALERLAQNPNYRMEIADTLEPYYQTRGNWSSLVALLMLKLDMIEFPTDRSLLLRQVAELTEEKLSDPQTAFGHYCEALKADPEEEAIGEHAERLAETCGTWAELTAAYAQVAQDLDDDLEQREMLLKVASLHHDKLGDSAAAEEHYRLVLELEPSNTQALDALEKLYAAQGRHDALYEVYSLKADVLFDAEDRKLMFMQMANLAVGDLGDENKAIDAWKRLREVDDTDVDALAALQTLYNDGGHWPELLEVLERRAELSDSIDDRVSLMLLTGEVARERLGDEERAMDAYRSVLDLEAGNMSALTSLEDLYTETEQWLSLQEVLGQHLTFAESEDQRIGLHMRLAKLSEVHFEDLDGALDHYRQVTLITPDHEEATANLERLYTQAGRWYDLQEIHLQRLERTEDPDARLALYVSISNVAAEHLGDVATAKEYLQKVLDVEPDNMGALDVLGKLFQSDGEWDKAMGVLDRQIGQSSDPSVLSSLHARRGVILEDHLDNPEGAEAAFRQAFDLDAGNSDARDALKRVYERVGNWSAMLELYRLEGAQITDAAEKVTLYTEIARIAREHLGDADAAVEALEVAYEASEGSLDVAEPLLQAYVDAEQWNKAEPILDGIIATLTERRKLKQLFKFHYLRGQIAEKKGRLEDAMVSYKAAYDIDATYVPNLLALGKLYVAAENWDDALKVFQTLLLHQMKIKNDTDKRDVYYNLGMVRMQRADNRRAKDMFNRALAIDRSHGPSKAALEQLD